MKDHIEQRLHELKAEFEVGQNLLTDLEKRQAHLRSSLLRINGAIQVLEELLSQEREKHAETEELETLSVATR